MDFTDVSFHNGALWEKLFWALVGATIPSVATGHNWKQGSAASSYLVSIKVYELRIVSHMALFTSLKFSLMKGLAYWLFIERAQHYKSQILIWWRHYPQIRGRVGRVQIGKLLWDTVLPPSGSKLTILQHTNTPLYYIPTMQHSPLAMPMLDLVSVRPYQIHLPAPPSRVISHVFHPYKY